MAARALAPLASLYATAAARRLRRLPAMRSALPVLCIGNFTAGGTGKTPLALYVAGVVAAAGLRPAFLTRGYGGRTRGPHWVDLRMDSAAAVGDEPLLLAARHPTMLARERAEGARTIVVAGCADVIVMDDGLQNPALAKDLSIAVVDGRRGIGNGRVIPAGPLRAPLEAQLAGTDAIVVNAPASEEAVKAAGLTAEWLKRTFTGPVLVAQTVPAGDTAWLSQQPIVAFAGIGAPARFFALLRAMGARLAASVTFPDHHPFTERDARRLLDLARRHDALLVTTEKDAVRLGGARGALADVAGQTRALGVEIRFEPRDAGRLAALIEIAVPQVKRGGSTDG